MRPLAVTPSLRSDPRPGRRGRTGGLRRLLRLGTACGAIVGATGALPAGCAFQDHRLRLDALHAQGRYDQAAQMLDDPAVEKMYGERSRLLWWLDRGAIALAVGEPRTALDRLERAEEFTELRLSGPTAAEGATQWLLNDAAATYIAEPYEQIYINVLKLLAQLSLGNIEGGATVEARRLASKTDRLRDLYVRYRDALAEEGGPGFQSTARRAGVPVSASEAAQFVESTLGAYLAAVTFMAAGDREFQEVAGRRLLDSIRLQSAFIGDVRPEPFEDLGRRDPDAAGLLVVALSGRGPTKVAERIGPILIFDWPVYYEIPVLRGGSTQVRSGRIVVAPAEGAVAGVTGGGDPLGAYPLALVENMAAVAMENHRRQLPLIQARALLRATAKAGASFAATRSVRSSGNDGWTALGAAVAGLAFIALTERADVRSWQFLPGQAHVALLDLPPGTYRVRVEYLGHGGGTLYAADWKTVQVPARGLATVVEHYWR